jgi:hypothetical protein
MNYVTLFDLGVADRYWHSGYRLSFQRFREILGARGRGETTRYDSLLRIIGPRHMSALEALASPLSKSLTLSATRHRLNLVRDRMKNALDALDQALISQGLSTMKR